MDGESENATKLSIAVGPEEVIAVFKPALTPEEQQAIDEAARETARQARHIAEVVRVLMIHASKHGRTLAIETSQR